LPTEEAVRAVLVGPADLGEEFVVVPPAASPVASLGKALRDCAEISDSGEPVVSAQTALQAMTFGSFVSETVEVSALAEAARQVSGLDAALTNCREFSDDTGAGLTIRTEPLSLAPVGDEFRAFRMTASVQGTVLLNLHLVVVRVGDVIVRFTLAQLLPPDPARTQKVVEAAVAKARALSDR
jgi:hypothetical protein